MTPKKVVQSGLSSVGGSGKAKRVIYLHAKDTDIQRLEELRPLMLTDFEAESNYTITDSETVRRIIYQYHRIKLGDKRCQVKETPVPTK